MRFHRNLVVATIEALKQIFNDDRQADKVLQSVLKKDKRWGARDRGFIAETTYDIVRWKRLYGEIAEVKAPYSTADLYRLFAVWSTLKGHGLPDWKEFTQTPTRRVKGRFDELSKTLKYRESIPDWLDELGKKELGDLWEKEIHALNSPADVILRANSLKTTTEQLAKQLEAEEIRTQRIEGYPLALRLEERKNVFTTAAFKDGLFEVQDASSQLVAPLLAPKPGMRVIDACAGAGGKSLHLACLMENKGQIIALDIYQQKLNELKRRARRNGAHNIETRLVDSTKVIKKLREKADKVLIDAPCSGLGILRRNPDSKWKLQPAFLDEIRSKQQQILNQYSSMVKPGGQLLYATCSILPSENQHQVAAFLASEAGKSFKLLQENSILVHQTGHDGFYMALMEKAG
jgi:16S rRNA (cytosine967-C5)-methyltransferase